MFQSANVAFFDIRCVPVPKARPRLGKNGVYTPEKSSKFEELLRWHFATKRVSAGKEPIAVATIFRMPVADSWSKKKIQDSLYKSHTQKPDVDNLQKQVLDAMKKATLFHDDSQVASEYSEKIWVPATEAGIEIGFFWGEFAKSDMMRFLVERREAA